MPDVTILHAPLPCDLPASRVASLLERLPYARRLELESRDPAARSASLLGLELLLEGVRRLRGHPPELARLSFPQDGKPRLDGGPWFSTTHTASRIAVALSDDCDLGIDLEECSTAGPDRAALQRWTATEAALKALGLGVRHAREVKIDEQLAIARLHDRVLHLRTVDLGPDCIAHLATLAPVGEVEVRKGMGDRGQCRRCGGKR
jgi:phosphopantetheinyl transferase